MAVDWSADVSKNTHHTHHAARYTATYDNAGFLEEIKMMYPAIPASRQVVLPISL
jgi:hypothetical protein